MRPIALGLILLLTLAMNLGFSETEPAVALIRAATGRLSLDGVPLENAAIGILTLDPAQTLRVDDGLLELELIPGAFLRAAGGTEVRLLSKDPERVSVELLAGQAILAGSKGLLKSVTIHHAGSTARFSQTGYYLWDVLTGSEPRMTVVKGKATVEAAGASHPLKSKQAITLTAPSAVEKVRRLTKDELMEWSRRRQDDYVLSRRRQKGFADLAIPGTIRQ